MHKEASAVSHDSRRLQTQMAFNREKDPAGDLRHRWHTAVRKTNSGRLKHRWRSTERKTQQETSDTDGVQQ